GISPSQAFPKLRGELVGLVSLVLGYTGLHLQERLFKMVRPLGAFGLNSAMFICLFALVSPVLHLRTMSPALPFLACAAARLLQGTFLRRVWYLGTVVPVAAACLNAGRLLSIGSDTPFWAAVVVRWAGLTGACYLLTVLSRRMRWA